MKPFKQLVGRRALLRGAGGVAIGLPLLDIMMPTRACAAAPSPVFGAVVVEMNGVQQGQADGSGEAERFWPAALGALTTASMTAASDRATSELADYADKLLMIRNIRLPFGADGCAHSSSGNQLLTAAKYGPAGAKSLAFGESFDNYVGRSLGFEPLNLYAGPKSGYIDDHISFRGKNDVRVGENNPFTAYKKIVGLNRNPQQAAQVAAGRKSVNDLVRVELNALRARTDLSEADRKRLDMHFDAIRDIEVKIVSELPVATQGEMKAIDGKPGSDQNRLTAVRLQYDIMAFALAAGFTQLVVIQVGDGTDGMQYTLDGMVLPRFHPLSHRATSDSKIGDSPDKDKMEIWHHRIDVLRLGLFKHLLDQLAAFSTPEGNLLEVGFALWTNSIATGFHRQTNIPWLIAGNARKYFKNGLHMTADGGPLSDSMQQNVTNNQLLNTLIGAFGARKADGSPVDDFGDPSLPRGTLSKILV